MAAFATVGRADLCRFLLTCQGLLPQDGGVPPATPAGVLALIRQLECVQIDPVAAVERNQHLVLAARIPGYAPALLEGLLGRGQATR
ncbi:MAG: hypothetical protein C4337_09820 [Armatimonadota bacterium]